MSEERIVIEVTERGARVVEGNLRRVGAAAEETADATEQLRHLLEVLVGAEAIRRILELADAYTEVQNQLKQVTSSSNELRAVTDALFRVSQNTRTGFQKNAEIYNDFVQATQDLSFSARELIDIQETLNEVVAMGGGSFEEGQQALNQFILRMQKGGIESREFILLLNRLPDLADVLSKAFGKTLPEIALQVQKGSITLEDFLRAIQSQAGAVDATFAKLGVTLPQAFTQLQNAAINTFGKMDEGLGITEGIAEAVKFLADNFDTLAKVLQSTVITLFAALLPAAIGQTIAALRLLMAAINANPWTALITVVVGAITTLTLFRDQIVLNQQTGMTLGDVYTAAGKKIASAFEGAKWSADDFGGKIVALLKGDMSWGEFFADTAERALMAFDIIVAGFQAVITGIKEGVKAVPELISSAFTQAANLAIIKLDSIGNTIVGILNKFGGNFDGFNTPLRTYKSLDDIGTSIKEKVKQSFSEGIQDGLTLAADKAARDRQLVEAMKNRHGGQDALGVQKGSGQGTGFIDPEAVKKEEDAIKQLLKQVLPMQDAQKDLEEGQARLDKLYRSGALSLDDYTQATANLRNMTADARNPLQALTNDITEQLVELQLHSREREIQNQLYSDTQRLQQAGQPLTEKETASLRERLELLQQQNELTQATDQLLNEIVEPQRAYNTQVEALNKLFSDGEVTTDAYNRKLNDLKITFLDTQQGIQVAIDRTNLKLQKQNDVTEQAAQAYAAIIGPAEQYRAVMQALNALLAAGAISQEQFTNAARDARIAYLDTQRDMLSGAERAFLKLQKSATDFASITEDAINNVVDRLGQAFDEFVEKGRIDLKLLANDLLKFAAQFGAKQLLGGLLQLGSDVLGGVLGDLFGGGGGGLGSQGAPMNTSGSSVMFHAGNVGGARSASRVIDKSLFANAVRYHMGTGSAGSNLAPNEMPAILERGETVRTRAQEAALKNGSGTVVIVNNNVPNSEATAQESQDPSGQRRIDVMIDEISSQNLSNRNSMSVRALRRGYGVRAPLVGR